MLFHYCVKKDTMATPVSKVIDISGGSFVYCLQKDKRVRLRRKLLVCYHPRLPAAQIIPYFCFVKPFFYTHFMCRSTCWQSTRVTQCCSFHCWVFVWALLPGNPGSQQRQTTKLKTSIQQELVVKLVGVVDCVSNMWMQGSEWKKWCEWQENNMNSS